MQKGWLIGCGCFLLLVCCGEKEGPVPVEPEKAHPAVTVALLEENPHGASFQLSTRDATEVLYGCDTGPVPVMNKRQETGNLLSARFILEVTDLAPDTDYCLRLQAVGPAGEKGEVKSLSFSTPSEITGLYSWESERGGIPPTPADMTLIPGPSSHRNPLAWSKDRWAKHVAYIDQQGKEHWLFDSFLLIEGSQTGIYGGPITTYVTTENSRPSANKEQWLEWLDFWFNGGRFYWQESFWGNGVDRLGWTYSGRTETLEFPEGQLDALEECVQEVAGRIGAPACKRQIIMTLPEPIYFSNYVLGVTNPTGTPTRYWGSLNGRELDFSHVDDRVAAYRWFMDQVRKAFDEKAYQYIELGGFYILQEVLDTQWRDAYKRYGAVIPAVASYAHSCNEALYWIPYCMAEGYDKGAAFGFDYVYMQPNWYWDNPKHSLDESFDVIVRNGLGLELEFEYTMVENIQGAASAQKYRARLNDYLEKAQSSGIYGQRSIALYSGTDAMEQLANSPLPDDISTYHKLCRFIIDSPLKR